MCPTLSAGRLTLFIFCENCICKLLASGFNAKFILYFRLHHTLLYTVQYKSFRTDFLKIKDMRKTHTLFFFLLKISSIGIYRAFHTVTADKFHTKAACHHSISTKLTIFSITLYSCVKDICTNLLT
jgi:hypothetical protein